MTDITQNVAAMQERRFNWGSVVAGAVGAVATTFLFVTLGSGVGLALMPRDPNTTTFFTLGAIYFFASQAFGFTVGGYLVGRLIGPEIESPKEEEFRAAAHGFVMWGLVVVASLVILGVSPAYSGAAVISASSTSDLSTHATGVATIWSALALLFGAIVAIAAAISARWMDDKVSFSMARRY